MGATMAVLRGGVPRGADARPHTVWPRGCAVEFEDRAGRVCLTVVATRESDVPHPQSTCPPEEASRQSRNPDLRAEGEAPW